MDNTEPREYALHLFYYSANGTERWKAVVEALLPQISAEGPTCEAVLEEIGEKLDLSLANLEGAATPVSDPRSRDEAISQSELEERLKAMGHSAYGIFADDPGALDVFDEIEHLRDQHTIGGG